MELATRRPGLVLRSLEVMDAARYYSVLLRNRAHLTRFGDYAGEGAANLAWVVRDLTRPSGEDLRLGIWHDDELIGRVDLLAVDPPRLRIGYWLDGAATGAGLATAACTALLTYAHGALGATVVFAGVTHGNAPSTALLRRLGFERVAMFDTYDRYRLTLGSAAGG